MLRSHLKYPCVYSYVFIQGSFKVKSPTAVHALKVFIDSFLEMFLIGQRNTKNRENIFPIVMIQLFCIE